MFVRSPKGENLSTFCQKQGEVIAADALFDRGATERRIVDDRRRSDDELIPAGVGTQSALTEVVESPGIDDAFIVDRKTVVGAASDTHDVLQMGLLGYKTSLLTTRDESATKLRLLSISPRVHFTSRGQSENMVGSDGDVYNFDVEKMRHQDSFSLRSMVVSGESQESLSALQRYLKQGRGVSQRAGDFRVIMASLLLAWTASDVMAAETYPERAPHVQAAVL